MDLWKLVQFIQPFVSKSCADPTSTFLSKEPRAFYNAVIYMEIGEKVEKKMGH